MKNSVILSLLVVLFAQSTLASAPAVVDESNKLDCHISEKVTSQPTVTSKLQFKLVNPKLQIYRAKLQLQLVQTRQVAVDFIKVAKMNDLDGHPDGQMRNAFVVYFGPTGPNDVYIQNNLAASGSLNAYISDTDLTQKHDEQIQIKCKYLGAN